MKDFKVAQIVPLAQLEDIRNNHYHMCLAHLVKEDKTGKYAEFYKRMSAEGKYVLMDNGAAECSQLDTIDLLRMYEQINPTEIVLPDTLSNSADTIRKTFNFINELRDLPYKFMAVPQGQTFSEWKACANVMLREKRINSIGVSKFLNITTGNNRVRLDACSYVEYMARSLGRRDIEIHLLGCDEGPSIVGCINRLIPNVRGCDSAFVYIASKTGIEINEATQRPSGEIDFLNGEVATGFDANALLFESIVGVGSNIEPTLWRE